MVFDDSVKKLISAAYHNGQDIFLCARLNGFYDFSFDQVKTAVLLPNAFYSETKYPFSDIKNASLPGLCTDFPDILFVDVRFMAEEFFRDFLTDGRYSRIIIPFAELADIAEYGYKHSFAWIGEYKAERADFCQITAFFSRPPEDMQKFISLYNTGDTVFVGEEILPEIRAIKAENKEAEFYLLASEIEKYAFKRIAVYFTTRLDMSKFGSFLYRRRTPFSFFNGSLSPDIAKREIKGFKNGESFIMTATKSFVASSGFDPPDKVFYCGAPYSVSHLMRCCAFLKNESPLVVFSEDDFEKNEKISFAFANIVEESDVVENRRKNLLEIKTLLNGYKE